MSIVLSMLREAAEKFFAFNSLLDTIAHDIQDVNTLYEFSGLLGDMTTNFLTDIGTLQIQ